MTSSTDIQQVFSQLLYEIDKGVRCMALYTIRGDAQDITDRIHRRGYDSHI